MHMVALKNKKGRNLKEKIATFEKVKHNYRKQRNKLNNKSNKSKTELFSLSCHSFQSLFRKAILDFIL